MATSYKIYPTIGIARVGNSPDAMFIGPEAPGIVPDADGSYRDDQKQGIPAPIQRAA
jgi:hypothetical protein